METKKIYDVIFFTFPNVDMIAPIRGLLPIISGTTTPIKTLVNEPGGPANILIAGKRLGLNILPVGTVGDDYYGKFLLEEYQKEGLDISQITIVPGYETRKVVVLVDEGGNHAFVSMVEGNETPNKNAEELINKSKSLCFSGYPVAVESSREESMRILRLAKKAGVWIFFDPGPLVKDIPQEDLNEILEDSTVTIMNETEATAISPHGGVEQSASFFLSKTRGIVVIKAGPKGCFCISHDDPIGRWYEGFNVRLIDTTGAGDSFWAAFMYGFISDWNIETIARFSNAVGAAKVAKMGSGTQVPNFDEAIQVLEKGGFSIPEIVKKERDFKTLVLKR
jgi:sugar/nucleoside kinase (ribokinase family)